MTGRHRSQSRTRRRRTSRAHARPDEAALLRRIQGGLSLDLRHPDYPVQEHELEGACLGHCYVATEAAYHLYGKSAGFVPCVLRHAYGTHWWLVHEETGRVLDPTEPQLGGRPFEYTAGHRANFLTKRPSRRAAELIRRVRAAAKRR